MTLDELRSEIDKVDDGIFELFAKRMQLADDIARVKIDEGLPILNNSREQEIINKISDMTPEDYKQYAVSLCSYIMELSRTRQRSILINEGKRDFSFKDEIKNIYEEKEKPRVVVHGIPGCYSAAAAKKMYDGCEIIYAKSREEALYTLKDDSADYGVLPISNYINGSIIDVYNMLIKHNLKIVKTTLYPVEYSILGIRGSTLNDIKEVYSFPCTFHMCKAFFKKHCRIKRVPYTNTTIAARQIAYWGDKTKAVLAPPQCAHLYGLDILSECIRRSDNNFTQYISISRRIELHDNAERISIVFMLPNVLGSLYRVLSRFAFGGYNLEKIESWKNPENPLEYLFYVDFDGSVKSPTTLNLLGSLYEELPYFKFLGNYNINAE
jgi:chorismate mutase/prephenate dehydratase